MLNKRFIIGITNADEYALFIEEEKTVQEEEELSEKERTTTLRKKVNKSDSISSF